MLSRGYGWVAAIVALCLLAAGGAQAAKKPLRADLRVASVANPPATVTAGGSFVSSSKIRNSGAATAGSSTTRYFLSRDRRINRGDVKVGEHGVRRLRARRSVTRSATLKIPAFVQPGTYWVVACADRRRRVRERSERNNCAATKRRLQVVASPVPGPKQTPASLGVTPVTQTFGSVPTGSSSDAKTLTVTNTGQAPSGTLATTVTGGDSSHFAVASDGCGGKTLPGGASCTLTVRFAPTSTGAKSAAVRVSGTPGGTASTDVSGTGITAAQLAISPANHSYGNVPAGSSSGATTFTITNTGQAPSAALTASLVGPDATQFAATADGCGGRTLAGGGTCTVSVRFSPASAGAKSASLRVAEAAGGSVAAALSGSGVLLTVTPASRDFGGIAIGSMSAATEFTITNVSTTPVAVGAAVVGADAPQFQIVMNNCPANLAAGASCAVSIRFQPLAPPGARSASFEVGPLATRTAVPLSGTALTPANLTIAPTSQGFGTVRVGQSSSAITFTIRNTGQATSGTVTAQIQGSDASQFTIPSGGNTCTGTLAGGASCTVSVVFSPTSAGNKSASLQASASPGGTVSATLTGEGTVLTIAPASHDFASVPVNQVSGTVTFTVTNTGATTTPTLTAALTDLVNYTTPTNGCTGQALAAGATCTVQVQFVPKSTGLKLAQLQISGPPGSPGFSASASLSGTGT